MTEQLESSQHPHVNSCLVQNLDLAGTLTSTLPQVVVDLHAGYFLVPICDKCSSYLKTDEQKIELLTSVSHCSGSWSVSCCSL